MPNEKILNEKKAVVDDLTRRLGGVAGVLVDYSGITVAEDTEMRAKLRAERVEYGVVKNTLMRFAINNVGLGELDHLLNGTTSLATSTEDAVAPARVIKEFATKFTDHFEIKGGFMDGRALSVAEVNSLASIPALPVLQAQLLGTMLAPIVSLAVVIKAIAEQQGGTFAPADADLTVEPETEAVAEASEAAEATEPADTAESAAEPAPAESDPPAESPADEPEAPADAAE
jgi:large subunit ribosomal protein L10